MMLCPIEQANAQYKVDLSNLTMKIITRHFLIEGSGVNNEGFINFLFNDIGGINGIGRDFGGLGEQVPIFNNDLVSHGANVHSSRNVYAQNNNKDILGEGGGAGGQGSGAQRVDSEQSIREEIFDNGEEVDESSSSNDSRSIAAEYLSSDDLSSFESMHVESGEEVDDVVKRRSRRQRYDKNVEIPYLCLGMEFSDAIEFREAITKYSIARGVKIKFTKNEPNRVRAKCQKKCPFHIFASKPYVDDPLVVKTLKSAHRCYRVFKNPRVSFKWLAN
ncbi:hypothetical protein GH714_030173 [Hevea brasiliensis]|uniref:Transposase MuDR plant domain-containing protein n=1 Tax=Hevea brasiliensis TaxID=3981 RepID=A0A6A6KFC0_HEVBR|nr:hypothetical protein GH714_030173 [Hevea brasiliensis]